MGPTWSFLLMYGSHDMRHTDFPQIDGGQRDPREMGRHTTLPCYKPTHYILILMALNGQLSLVRNSWRGAHHGKIMRRGRSC